MRKFSFSLIAMALALIVFTGTASSVLAQERADIGFNYTRQIGLAEAQDEDVRNTAVDIIKYLLTFLTIIAVAMILYGGFRWMTAGGNDDNVSKAKKIIVAGVIGLAIVLAAFAIITFVVDITYKALNSDF